jgi:hypothetical protein
MWGSRPRITCACVWENVMCRTVTTVRSALFSRAATGGQRPNGARRTDWPARLVAAWATSRTTPTSPHPLIGLTVSAASESRSLSPRIFLYSNFFFLYERENESKAGALRTNRGVELRTCGTMRLESLVWWYLSSYRAVSVCQF